MIQRAGDDYLEFDLDGDGRVDYVQRLRNGYKDQLCFLDAAGGSAGEVVDRPPGRLTDWPLVLMLLDGVAYQRIEGLYRAGGFRLFRRPARLISVFPTLTDPAYDLLFQTGPTPGYEAGYFDSRRNRLTRAFLQYLRGANEAWARQVDYRLSFLKDAVMYLFPRQVYAGELKRCRRVLDARLAGGGRQVALYILSTDGLAHMLSAAEIDQELTRLDDWIEQAMYDYRGRLEVVMLSDHGLGTLPPGCTHLRRFDLRGVLRAAGLRVRRRLARPGDLVVPLFGLLDVARVYTYDPATRDRAVAALRTCPEVEVLAARDGDQIHVHTGPASAVIRTRIDPAAGTLYGYQMVFGDPLDLAEACRTLRAAGRMDADGFASGLDWREASAELPFPAAPQRLWEGLFSISREQPDLIISLTDRWYVGSGLLSRFVKMQGTHGGLHRRATETFAMTTGLDLPSRTDLRQVGRLIRKEYGWQPAGADRGAPNPAPV